MVKVEDPDFRLKFLTKIATLTIEYFGKDVKLSHCIDSLIALHPSDATNIENCFLGGALRSHEWILYNPSLGKQARNFIIDYMNYLELPPIDASLKIDLSDSSKHLKTPYPFFYSAENLITSIDQLIHFSNPST